MSKTPEPTLVEQLEAALTQNLDENDFLRAEVSRLRAENAQLKTKLDAVMNGFSSDGMLGVLRQIAFDTSLPAEIRTRAAAAGAPFERPKLAMTANAPVVKLFDVLEKARLKQMEEREAAKARVIEHGPAGSILGSDWEGPPAMGPEADPAA
jgi:hypothetical protein